MSSTDTAFTGKIPELYDRLMGPMLFRPYAADMARRLADVTAAAARALAARFGTGPITASMEAIIFTATRPG